MAVMKVLYAQPGLFEEAKVGRISRFHKSLYVEYTLSRVISHDELLYIKIQLTLVISTSLISNNRLSRSEILSLIKHENLTTGKKYCGKEEKLLNFHNIFDISLNSRVQLHINLLNVVVRIIFSSLLQI